MTAIDPSHVGLAGTSTRVGLLRVTTAFSAPRPMSLQMLVPGREARARPGCPGRWT